MKKFIYGVVFVSALLLTGCADAGKDQSVISEETVMLDGSASKADFFGEIKKYRWKQVKGSKVSLSDFKVTKPTFTAPSVSKKTTLTFRLVTKEMGGYFSPWKTKDEVTIVINPVSTENKLPQALATVSAETIKYGQSVTFDASASTDSDGEIVSYEWTDAQGGILGSGVTLAHVFDTLGTHVVTLTVTDNEGATATASLTVTVNALQKPIADINASATVVRINDTVTFDANASTDSDGEIISYTWTDAQGNVLSDMVDFTQLFTISGEHNITLAVMDDDEQITTSVVSITVQALLLSVSLSSVDDSLEVNASTQLNATAHYNDNTTVPISSSAEWIVGDTSIVAIDANGTVKALKSGITSIMAKVGEIESNVISIEVIPLDTTAPILTLNGEAELTLIQGTAYIELGVTATDDRDENVSITQTGSVDTNTVGTYSITYTATDTAGNSVSVQRTVHVVLPPDVTAPTLTLNGESTVTLYQGVNYTELGATANDDMDGNVSVTITGTVDTTTVGNHVVTYSATDNSGNTATVIRTVTIENSIKSPSIVISDELNSTLSENTIPYNRMTLEIPATSTQTLTATNKTLSQEQNRTIRVKGVDNNGTFYLYNIPLIKGENQIALNATNEIGEEVIQSLTIHADANLSVPIGMRATAYEGVQSLETEVEVGTGLDAKEYLFDDEGDGIIDQTSTEGNFTVNLTDEGRYRPRVTVRTAEGLLFSSDAYALSLDVKATADQKDPKGAEPMDIAKEFIKALIEDDREKVKRLTGNSKNLLAFIYEDKTSLARAKKLAQEIDPNSWTQTYRANGSIEVRAIANDSIFGQIPIVIEIMYAYGDYVGSGRMLYVSNLY